MVDCRAFVYNGFTAAVRDKHARVTASPAFGTRRRNCAMSAVTRAAARLLVPQRARPVTLGADPGGRPKAMHSTGASDRYRNAFGDGTRPALTPIALSNTAGYPRSPGGNAAATMIVPRCVASSQMP